MRRLPAALILSLSIAVAATGCGSSSSGAKSSTNTQATGSSQPAPITSPTAAATAPADPAAATTAIKKVYKEFFSSAVPKAKTLVQDGSSLGQAFKIAKKGEKGATIGANPKSVAFTSPTMATVQYILLSNGKPAIPGGKASTGNAVLVNGKWLVAKSTFCGLVGLLGTTPADCM